MTRARSTFEVTRWDEKPYQEGEGGFKLTRASVSKTFQGDLEGQSTVEYLMVYPGEGRGATHFVGLERVEGKLGGRPGSFVLQHTGTDDGHTAASRYFVVPGSGTGELQGLRGEGGGAISRTDTAFAFELDYVLS
ncbi:MAG: DUF3224 domain-containing protein [Anaerolineales bacterium]|nr:DUF3224 domain-containing protein [Anaerolineales bacterium]